MYYFQLLWWFCLKSIKGSKVTFWTNCAFPLSGPSNIYLFFAIRDIWNNLLKKYSICGKSENDPYSRGRWGGVGGMLFESLWHITYDNRYLWLTPNVNIIWKAFWSIILRDESQIWIIYIDIFFSKTSRPYS